MSILLWIVFGLIVGSIANFIDPRDSQSGLLGSIILGIVGSVVGGYLGGMLLGTPVTGFNFTSMIVAVAGSLLVLFVARMFRRA
jgi:uncharacterized membrane protein YeaQ/YmgE (transglycosylase-associated protein family)